MDLFEIIKLTPWWVFFLFVGLIMIGMKAARPRTTSYRKLFLLPLIFTLWNLIWLNERVQGHYSLIVFWLIGLVLGSGLGWVTVRRWKISAISREFIKLPGTWSTLILIMTVFVVRYFFIYNYEAHPEAASRLFSSDAFISGTITGIFIGRALCLIRKYKKTSIK
jgi:hypothetical protein